ncbi:asparagine synthase (glutamine-hydrolyzing) [Rhodocytophaga aerolata]|uniref:asparagine synthase (glutamine-hydrolyzing) n=1 Tax=Rhodocytophaga aerolata TaxID=455078 RepID=A0ABT8RGE9_9BACT|nr:asparagine synthase (glutamine-hydrolyzing) [Rhodocytophaga aerolata]MDO1449787.1 asparagine synthase (glutamine-hydrolyzing) [Rhodocytophaga aerolata]
MCRVAGTILSKRLSFQDSLSIDNPFKNTVYRMISSMAHGGPDDEGLYVSSESTVIFGHRRLSLLDLSPAGHQPMSTADATVVISFNGEIYNYQQLRSELIEKGYTFKNNTDTEVILNAYKEWGEGAFLRFNGMFAFALHDIQTKQVYLVRDHSGIKPLYYTTQGERLTFASEVRAFAQTDLVIEEQPEWKIYFLSLGFIPEPYTTYKNVFMLPKGHFLKWDVDSGEYKVKQYFRYTFSSTILSEKEATQLIREKLEASVRRHLISDAPIGLFLSGGIDSSLLTLLANKDIKDKLHTLSIVFDEERYTEKKYQQLIIDKIKGNHSFYRITKEDFERSLVDILQAMDQPSMDGINTYFISRCAKEEGLKAVLSGLGADELLGGYPSFKRAHTFTYTQYLPSFSYRLGNFFINDKLKKTPFLSLEGDMGKYLFLRGLINPDTVADILEITEREVLWSLQKLNTTNRFNELGPGNFASWIETNFYMQNQLLKDSDVMSMWHGVEIRVPFLDKELIELAFQIHPKIKFGKPQAKWLLISAFKDILPEPIWNRPKQGFELPFNKWMKKNELMLQMLHSPNKTVRKLTIDFEQERLQWSRLWAMVLSEKWHHQSAVSV